jgi:hypothetical protein
MVTSSTRPGRCSSGVVGSLRTFALPTGRLPHNGRLVAPAWRPLCRSFELPIVRSQWVLLPPTCPLLRSGRMFADAQRPIKRRLCLSATANLALLYPAGSRGGPGVDRQQGQAASAGAAQRSSFSLSEEAADRRRNLRARIQGSQGPDLRWEPGASSHRRWVAGSQPSRTSSASVGVPGRRPGSSSGRGRRRPGGAPRARRREGAEERNWEMSQNRSRLGTRVTRRILVIKNVSQGNGPERPS